MRALLALLTTGAAAVSNAAARSGLALSLRAGSLEALEADQAASKESPIKRVVTLLQEMKVQLEKDSEADSAAYDKMVCWCDNNEKAKTKAISDADVRINELTSEVGTRGGRGGELGVKIAQMKTDLAEMKDSLAKATAMREKEHASFDIDEKEMVQAVTMLKNAIMVLSRHNAGLLQMTPAVQESLGSALRWAALKHEEMLALATEGGRPAAAAAAGRAPLPAAAAALLSTAEKALRADASAGAAASALGLAADEVVLRALRGGARSSTTGLPAKYASRVLASAAARGAALVQGPAHLQSYAPQSGQIFGILKQMQEEFEANLSEAQKQEMKAREEYGQLKSASEERISASAEALDELEADHSANIKALSDAKEDLATTREVRSADVNFLSDLRLKCQALDTDWKERSRARGLEIKAVSETIAILTEDDARELFHKKMGAGTAAASFLQRAAGGAAGRTAARARAAALLLKAAGGLRRQEPDVSGLYKAWRSADDKPHEKLAAMAVRVQLDAFTKVKKAIDDMVVELKQQQEEEVKHKAECNAELKDNEKMTYETKEALQDVTDKIGSLDESIQKLTEAIATAKEDIASMEVEIKKAGEVREQENKEFQQEVSDQRAVQNILKKAMARLRMVYKQQEALAQEAEEPAPPAQFQPYKQNAGSTPVISMIEAIVKDSESVEADAVAAEQEAQKAYELMVADANESIARLQESIKERGDAKSEAEVEREEAQAHQQSTETKLQDLAAYASDLHQQCDFVLKNFDIRQAARLQEIEALQGAKALLSGMSADDD